MNKYKHLFLWGILLFIWNPLKTIAQASNDSCYQAIEVFCGTFQLVDFGGYNPDAYNQFEDCEYYDYNESIWYKITGTGDILQISLCNFSVNLKILEGDCDSLICFDEYLSYRNYQCGNSSAEVGFKSEVGKEYYIYCNTINPQLQSTFSVNCISPASNNFCESAQSILIDSPFKNSHIGAYYSQHPEDCQPYYEHFNADMWYTFQGTGELVSVETNEPNRGLPTSLIKGDCDNYECVPSLRLSSGRKAYQTEANATYFFRIYGVNTDSIEVRLKPIIRHPQDECSAAKVLSLNDSLVFNFENVVMDNNACGSGFSNDIWYTFTGNDSIIKFTLSGQTYRKELNVLSGTDCEQLVCESITINGSNQYALQTTNAQNYYLNLSTLSYSENFTDATVVFDAATPVENDTYEQATLIACQDTIVNSLANALSDTDLNNSNVPSMWYKVIGTNDFYSIKNHSTYDFSLQAQFYTLSDNILEPFYGDSGYQYLEQDSIYYINVFSRTGLDSFQMSLNCLPAIENDICAQATVINTSDTIIGNTFLAQGNELVGCGNNGKADIWYQLSGDGKLYDFTFKRTANRQEFSILKGNCDSLECIDYYFALQNSDAATTRIFLEDNADYYIRVYNRYGWEDKNFEFYFDEYAIAQNDICSDAKILSCGDVVIDSLDFATANDTLCELTNTNYTFYNKGVWYQIQGEDKYVELYFPTSNGTPIGIRPSIFEGTCGQLTCISDQVKIFSKKHVFFGEAGKTYYISIAYPQKITFEVNCFDKETNDKIEDAPTVACGDRVTGYSFFANKEIARICPYPSNTEDIWWKMEGNNQMLYIEDLAKIYRSPAGYIYVYTYNNENQLECEGYFNGRLYLDNQHTYYLRYELTAHSSKHFDLKFTCFPPPINDVCSNALSITCNDTIITNDRHTQNDSLYLDGSTTPTIISNGVWVKVIGDNTFKQFSGVNLDGSNFLGKFQFFKGLDCENLTTVPKLVATNHSIFYAEAGVVYYIAISGNNNDFKLTMECVEQATNDYCHNALPLSCGDTINASLDYALNCDYGEGASCYAEKQVWYTIQGTGGIIQLDLMAYAGNDHRADINIYYNDCCQKISPANIYGTQHHKQFLSTLNESYLVGISLKAIDNDGDFELAMTCFENDHFNFCENKVALTNQQSVVIDVSKATNYYNPVTFSNKPSSWVNFIGSGGIDTLSFSADDLDAVETTTYIDFYNNCDLSTLIATHLLPTENNKVNLLIPTLEGLNYVVKFSEYHDFRAEIDTLTTQLSQASVLSCKMDLSFDTLFLDYNNSITVQPLAGNTGGITSASIREGTTNYNYNGSFVNYTAKSEGYKIVSFYTEDPSCWGHDYFYLKHINPVPVVLECPDSVFMENTEIPNGDCDSIKITASGQQIEVSALPPQSKIEIIGQNTNWQLVKICDGDCFGAQVIEDLAAGDYTVKVNLFSQTGEYCYLEKMIQVSADETGCAQPDYPVLAAIYAATDGANWRNQWDLSNCDVCNWHGVTCDESGRVTELRLSINNLQGTIPEEIGQLDQLTFLDMSLNILNGIIPKSLQNLEKLEAIYLGSNRLTGILPEELSTLKKLRTLQIQNNNLEGIIAPSFGGLDSLISLDLSGNNLSGSIPPELGLLSNLRRINLDRNQLSGVIPITLGNATKLGSINLRRNQLTGSIPPNLGNLTNLVYLNLSANQLTGEIPKEFANIPVKTLPVMSLILNNNDLSGCYYRELKRLCGVFDEIRLYNNPGLPDGGGTFDNNSLCRGGEAAICTTTINCDNLSFSTAPNELTIDGFVVNTTVTLFGENTNWQDKIIAVCTKVVCSEEVTVRDLQSGTYTLKIQQSATDGSFCYREETVVIPDSIGTPPPIENVNCDQLAFIGETNQITVTGLSANYNKVEIIGKNTNWQVLPICETDCPDTLIIPDLLAGEYVVKINQVGSDEAYCYREEKVIVSDEEGSITEGAANCDNLAFKTENGQITVTGLTATYDKVEIIGRNTGWQVVTVCDGDCADTQIIPDLANGEYAVKINQTGNDDTYCYREEKVVITNSSSNRNSLIDFSKELFLYPNPAKSSINLQFHTLTEKEGTIQIYNVFGQLIQSFPSTPFTNNPVSINLDGYENGLYLLTVKVDKLPVMTKRFVVEHLK